MCPSVQEHKMKGVDVKRRFESCTQYDEYLLSPSLRPSSTGCQDLIVSPHVILHNEVPCNLSLIAYITTQFSDLRQESH